MATDQEIRDAGFKYVPQQQYLLNPFELPENQEPVVNQGIVNTNAFTNSGGGSGGALQVGDSMMNFDNFYNYTGNKYMMNQDRPNLDSYSDNAQKTFLGMPSYRQQELTGPDMGEYIASGTNIPLEQTMAGNIQDKIGSVTGGIQELMGKVPTLTNILNRIGVQNFNSLSPADQLFIKTNSGYRGPTVFGENTGGGNVDPFGMNVESLMGNYAEGVRDNFSQLKDTLTKDRPGVTFNEVTGMFEGEDEDLVAKTNKQTNMIRNKFLFRKKQQDQQDKNQRDIDKKAAQDAAIAAAANRAGQIAAQKGADVGVSGGGRGSRRGDADIGESSRGGFATDDTAGFFARGGRAGYFFGGRVNYKVGGRTDAESQYGADSVGSYDSSQNRSDRGQSYGGNNKPPVSNDNSVVTTDFISKKPSLTIDYTDPKNYASIYSKMGFNNLLDNDDLTVEGDFATNMGPVTTNTKFTDDGIGNTDINYGNFSTTIDPNKNIKNIGYNNSYNGINYGVNYADGNTMFNVGTTFKNGGLASIL